MTWLIVGICVLVVGIIIYYSIPLFKKFFGNRDASKSAERATKRAIKKEEKRAEKEEKNALKKRREQAPTPVAQTEQQASENSLVNENAIDLKEDPDEKVNMENLSYDGYFDSPSIAPAQQKPITETNPLEENVDDLFNRIFNIDKPESKIRDQTPTFVSDGTIDGRDEEIRDFLEEFERINSGSDKSSIAEDFEKLSPEMKALMISNFLDRKE